FDDAVDARVAEHALDTVLAHVPFAAPDLQRVVDDLPQAFGAEQLAHGRFEHDVAGVAIDRAGSQIGDGVHGEDHLGHVGDLFLDQVEFAQVTVELLAGRGALDG